MKTRLSWTIRVLSLTTLSLWALSAAAATNYTSFSSLPASQVISNADGMAFYWKSNGIFFSKRIAWSNLLSQVTSHSTNADYASAIAQTNFDWNFARVGSTGTIAFAQNVPNALTTNQGGVWLVRSNQTRFYFTNDLASAYTNEGPFDYLEIGPGLYSAPYPITKSIKWYGKLGVWDFNRHWVSGGTIITNQLLFTFGSSNVVLQSLAVLYPDAAIGINVTSTNYFGGTFRDLIVACPTNQGGHAFFCTGSSILIERCQIYDCADHGLAVLGSSNVIVRDCISLNNQASSYVVKSDQTQGGNCGNILFENCIGDGIFLCQSAGGCNLTRVSFNNCHLINQRGLFPGTQSWWLQAEPGTYIKDFSITHCTITGLSPTDANNFLAIYPNGGSFTNITVTGCVFENRYRTNNTFLVYAGGTPTALDTSQLHLAGNRVNEWSVDYGDGGGCKYKTRTGFKNNWGDASSWLAISPDDTEKEFATNGALYITHETNYNVFWSGINVGDPIRVLSGAAAGVYPYLSNGVNVVGVGLPTATNRYFIAVARTGTNGLFSPASLWQAGKAMANVKVLMYRNLLITVNSLGVDQTPFLERDASEFTVRGNADGVSVDLMYSTNTSPAYFKSYCPISAFTWGGQSPYWYWIGIFGGSSDAFTVSYFGKVGAINCDITLESPYAENLNCNVNHTWTP